MLVFCWFEYFNLTKLESEQTKNYRFCSAKSRIKYLLGKKKIDL